MTRYSRPRAEQPGELVGDDRICSSCGRLVSTADQYCSGCGVAFAGTAEPALEGRRLPGFRYHFVQGFGWGLGFALAGATITAIVYGLYYLVWRLASNQ
jgi:hypothetical protein